MPQYNDPFQDINQYFLSQLSGAQSRGDKSGATNYSRQLDDLNLFRSLFGGGMNQAYQSAFGNLSQAQSMARARGQGTAGAIAGSRGSANPGSFILGAGNTAAAPYVTAQQNLATQQLFGNQDMMKMLLSYLQGQQGQRIQQQQYNDQSGFDWSSLFPMIGTIGAAAI